MKLRLTDQTVQQFLKCLGDDNLTIEEIEKKYYEKYRVRINSQEIIDLLIDEREIQIWSKNHNIAYIRTPRIRWKDKK